MPTLKYSESPSTQNLGIFSLLSRKKQLACPSGSYGRLPGIEHGPPSTSTRENSWSSADPRNLADPFPSALSRKTSPVPSLSRVQISESSSSILSVCRTRMLSRVHVKHLSTSSVWSKPFSRHVPGTGSPQETSNLPALSPRLLSKRNSLSGSLTSKLVSGDLRYSKLLTSDSLNSMGPLSSPICSRVLSPTVNDPASPSTQNLGISPPLSLKRQVAWPSWSNFNAEGAEHAPPSSDTRLKLPDSPSRNSDPSFPRALE
mmetsp:Transcript_6693/g.12366  ORF Transcript_6693/g.12366 Transcript_6693/m.12366 type:complete len:259 (-) Transcript_6693:407-1183(-)